MQWIYIGLVIRAKLSGFTWCTPVFLFSLPGMPARRLYVLLLLISSFLSISLWLIISGFTTNFQKFSPNGRNLIADNQSHLFSNDSRDVAIATCCSRDGPLPEQPLSYNKRTTSGFFLIQLSCYLATYTLQQAIRFASDSRLHPCRMKSRYLNCCSLRCWRCWR